MTTLLAQLKAWKPFSALVIGDFMLDQHVYGAAERLSPDAPVPVLQMTGSEDIAGGASNVALCLAALGGRVTCCGVVGEDPEGAILKHALEDAGCETGGIVADGTRPTTVKRSLVGLAQHRHPQKMFRVDMESRTPPPERVIEQLLSFVRKSIDAVDVVCLEDYDKGVLPPEVCADVIHACRTAGKEVLVDPAAIADYAKYKGATAITPNRTEAEKAVGDARATNDAMARQLLDALDLNAVVLTLDKSGALLLESGGEPVVVPTVAQSVYDVTGAGDMVLAALAGARANGIGWPQAVEFANAAAGLEVAVFGAQAIPLATIQREVLRRESSLDGKVRTLDDLMIEISVHRASGESIVFTNGCFDVVHAGHVAYLREAKQQGDVLVVGVNADAQVCAQKGPNRPVYPEAQRLEILSEFNCIDYLIVFGEPTAHELLRAIRPDVYVKGGDYAPEEINEYDLVQELGIDLRLLANRPGLGSTQVIEKLARD